MVKWLMVLFKAKIPFPPLPQMSPLFLCIPSEVHPGTPTKLPQWIPQSANKAQTFPSFSSNLLYQTPVMAPHHFLINI